MEKAKRAFSLVELMVVIGIIAILIALMLPTMARVREQAKTLTCASQLRQLGMGLHNYAVAYHGALPTWSKYHAYGREGMPGDDQGPGWTEQLERFFAKPTSGVYTCPSFPEPGLINYFLEERWANLRRQRNMKTSDIRLSSQFVLSGDCTQELLYQVPFGILTYDFDDCDKDDAVEPGVVFQGEDGGRSIHRGGNNILFADDHVALFKKFDPGAMTYHPSKMQAWDAVTPD